jgi:hypothetical protein
MAALPWISQILLPRISQILSKVRSEEIAVKPVWAAQSESSIGKQGDQIGRLFTSGSYFENY